RRGRADLPRSGRRSRWTLRARLGTSLGAVPREIPGAAAPSGNGEARRAIASWARGRDIATVAGPTTGGSILAHEVARQLGTGAIYAERGELGGREFRRGFSLAPGERVLVVDDIMSTGGSVHETIAAVRATG